MPIRLHTPENHRFLRKTDYVVESLRASILAGYIEPGTSLTEKQIKEVLPVSSSPIREALNQLEAEGLLVRSPHVGTKVAELFAEDVRELYAIQTLLECAAVQMCGARLTKSDLDEAERLNDEMKATLSALSYDVHAIRLLNYRFHMIVCGMNVHAWLARLIAAIRVRLPKKKTIWLIPPEARAGIRYHRKIVEALRRGDPHAASDMMRRHLEEAQRTYFSQERTKGARDANELHHK
ncbi:MAG TPA: GntR family transcriptional regulator [Candidatus Sulfotelmatobacter sp.]|nr:GntR family transcriptional regulator [Candidatus Sulfotelmatobacter sp.]